MVSLLSSLKFFHMTRTKATTDESECERDTLMVFPPAALRASPLSLTYQVSCVFKALNVPGKGAGASLKEIEIVASNAGPEVSGRGFGIGQDTADLIPLPGTFSALKTASFAAHRPAKDAVGSAAD
jgi:hypothetical protein